MNSPMSRVRVRACLAAALLASSVSPAFAVSYTWVAKSGTGDWTTSLNWSGTSATDLYPGSTTSTDTADARGDLVGDLTLNLDTSVSIQNLFLGDTTGTTTSGTFYTTTISTTNNSSLTFGAASAATNLSQINNAGGVGNGTQAQARRHGAGYREHRQAARGCDRWACGRPSRHGGLL